MEEGELLEGSQKQKAEMITLQIAPMRGCFHAYKAVGISCVHLVLWILVHLPLTKVMHSSIPISHPSVSLWTLDAQSRSAPGLGALYLKMQTSASEPLCHIPEQESEAVTKLPVLKVQSRSGQNSSVQELVRNANSWANPISTETLEAGPASCVSKPSR